MPNPVTTAIDTGAVAVAEEYFEDGLLTLAGADTMVAGTILARNTSTLKWQIYAKGGSSNGNGVPQGVMTYTHVYAGAGGDTPIRILTKGVVNKQRLIIDADGTGANVDAAVTDLLRSIGIQPIDVKQLNT